MAQDTAERFRNLIDQNSNDATKPVGQRTTRGVMSVVGQGLSLGTADEIEAFLRSKLTNQDYNTVLQEIRDSIESYRTANPIQSTLVEGGSAAIPMAIAAFFTGGSALIPMIAANATRFPAMTSVMRGLGVVPTSGLRNAAVTGATTGAAYGFASGEGSPLNRLQSAGFGAAGGAVGGPVAEIGGQVVGNLAVGVVDQARRMFGRRGNIIVERELQRISEETGQSIDDIVQQIYDGNVMAENATLREVIKGYKATGGIAGTNLSTSLDNRAERFRRNVGKTMQEKLSNTPDQNILRGNLEMQALAKTRENELYAALDAKLANGEVLEAATEAVNKVPGAMKELNEALRAQGNPPLFSTAEGSNTGELIPSRMPTVKEVEIIRRTIKNLASARYAKGKGTAGEAFQDAADNLTNVLDNQFPAAQSVRQTAAMNRANTEAFNDGTRAFTKSADEIEVDFAEVQAKGDAAIRHYKGGVMQNIRMKLAGPQQASFIRKLATEDTKERRILEIISGDQELDAMLRAIVRSARSSDASKAVTEYGAAKTQKAVQNQGSNVGVQDAMSAAMYNDPMAIVRLIARQLDTTQPGLSPADREKVVQVLLNNDPEYVRKMLQDESGMMKLQSAIQRAVEVVRGASTRAGQQMGATDMLRMQRGQNPMLMQGLLGSAY